MSHDDSIPVGIYDFTDEDEREEFLTKTFADITYAYHEAKSHDQRGFFADVVGGPGCLALGHVVYEDEDDDPLFEDGVHVRGWDAELICTATRYGTACTECEGECDGPTLPTISVWDLVRAKEA